jgi:hypothetical protein
MRNFRDLPGTPNPSPPPAFMRAAVVALVASLGLAACQSSMTALAPASGGANAPGTAISFLAVQGPSPDLAQKFEQVLAQEARKRGFDVVTTAPGATTLRVKTYLDAYASDDGKTGFAWVLDASENGRTRAARIKGAAQMSAPANAPWSALDETAMRQIAQMGIDDLVRHASGAPPAVAQVDEAQ